MAHSRPGEEKAPAPPVLYRDEACWAGVLIPPHSPCIVVDGGSQGIPRAPRQDAQWCLQGLLPVRPLHQPIQHLQEDGGGSWWYVGLHKDPSDPTVPSAEVVPPQCLPTGFCLRISPCFAPSPGHGVTAGAHLVEQTIPRHHHQHIPLRQVFILHLLLGVVGSLCSASENTESSARCHPAW